MAVAYDTSVVGSANGSNSWTLPALTTAGANELIIVNTHTSNNTTATPSSSNLTFVQVGANISYGGNGRQCVWRAFASSQLSGEVITITGSGFPQVSAVASAFSGTDTTGTNGSGAVGATNTGSSGGATSISAAITTTRDLSLVIGAFGETQNVTITAGSGQTIRGNSGTGVTFSRTVIETQNSTTTPSGSSVTCDISIASSNALGGMTLEIMPPDAGGGSVPIVSHANLSLMGVG